MIISRTPMRVSFAGGGSDLSVYYQQTPGIVLSTAIDRYIYITVNKMFDDKIRVSYSTTEIVDCVDDLKHNIIREALKIVGISHGVEVVYMGDIPIGNAGIGLGSSSSLAVGVLNALYAFKGMHVSAERLAREACQIEIEILGHPIGKQDQYIAAYGGINTIQFNQDESVFVDPVIFTRQTKAALQGKLMMFFTGLVRISSDILAEQKGNIRDNKTFLDKMVGLARVMRESLVANEFDRVGEILHAGWMCKRNLASTISCTSIDEDYQRAMDAGAIGGKILGAGGGGFLLFYCDEEKQASVRQALSHLKETPFNFEPQGSKIIHLSD
ncbi:GHMP family kinase ATP-binding protein [Pseudodesulfovibrio piezophilus]|uniref:GHMP kinase n=1 Tax=Pseudodesulfovibrio piezophilus (strain DSM 21447 / JCM 15486 / C1TLV30) TaxID=1322246 RepID=M1WMB5_PSEP2|nr:GHMP kinase [Pseudodesulfovibrio piezophilus]CCH49315.1 GHMP kinase [Pseudodesulfovibrio piezophilus C1TLV30]